MVSALVAFKGWPGGAAVSGIESVPLQAPPRPAAAIRIDGRAGRHIVHLTAAGAHASATAGARSADTSTAGLVKVPASGPSTVLSTPTSHATPGAPQSGPTGQHQAASHGGSHHDPPPSGPNQLLPQLPSSPDATVGTIQTTVVSLLPPGTQSPALDLDILPLP